MFQFDSPDPELVNPDDCGVFMCTGLYQVLAKFENTVYSGIPMPFGMKKNFQVTGNNKESVSSQVVPTCKEKFDWNAYMCDTDDLGVLLFESQDEDRMDRSSQPLYIKDDGRGFYNRLNAY
jgi:hypothetical protein